MDNKAMQLGVLFVDDEENILRSLRRLFMDEEFAIFIASSGEQGLEILKNTQDIALIVSDQRMPGMTGAEFLEKAKITRPETLRILLTGYSDINAVVDAINRGGAYRYLTKPWDDEVLKQNIREAVKVFALTRENQRLGEIIRQQNKKLKNWNAELQEMVQLQTMELTNQNNELKKLTERQRNDFKSMISAISGLIELRDIRVRSHSKKVAEISVRFAKKIGMGSSDIETVLIAALLHDIGKIGIPDVMLMKDFSAMSKDEADEYMKHPVRGQAAIDPITDLRPVGVLIRHHHERYNGGGFPDKLAGNAIPLGSRIIAFADFIDHTASTHRGDNLPEVILSKLEDDQGKQFDPQFIKYLRNTLGEVYAADASARDTAEKEFGVEQLAKGMTLSRDVVSGTGLLLMSKGTRLDDKQIKTLQRILTLDPSRSGVFVWLDK